MSNWVNRLIRLPINSGITIIFLIMSRLCDTLQSIEKIRFMWYVPFLEKTNLLVHRTNASFISTCPVNISLSRISWQVLILNAGKSPILKPTCTWVSVYCCYVLHPRRCISSCRLLVSSFPLLLLSIRFFTPFLRWRMLAAVFCLTASVFWCFTCVILSIFGRSVYQVMLSFCFIILSQKSIKISPEPLNQ